MIKPKDELIARKCFASLYLDYEYEFGEELGGGKPVECRVLIDGWFDGRIFAESREAAIAKFEAGLWER